MSLIVKTSNNNFLFIEKIKDWIKDIDCLYSAPLYFFLLVLFSQFLIPKQNKIAIQYETGKHLR